jgi:hypothetical protein
MCTALKPYRAPAEGSGSPSAQVRPDLVPDTHVPGTSRSSPPYKGDELTDEDGQRELDLWLVQMDATEEARQEDSW